MLTDTQTALACAEIPGVTVLPVARYRLSFARAAAEQVRASSPAAAIAVDLPHPLSGSEWLAASLAALPKPSNLLLHRGRRTFAAPLVANDAAVLALRTALDSGRTCACVDDTLPSGIPDPGGELPNDEPLPLSLDSYFGNALSPAGEPILPRAARIADRLRMLAARGEVLFICEWRLWPFVAAAARARVLPKPEPRPEVPAAILPEDPLLLWQAGFLDDLPLLSLEGFRAGALPFRKLDCLRQFAHRIFPGMGRSLETTLSLARHFLEPALELYGPPLANHLAAACLSFPPWMLEDLAEGAMPQFGRFTADGIEPSQASFPLPDIFGCEPLYPPSQAETLRFYPPPEAELRRYWGPSPTPPLTRAEAGIAPSSDDRWSAPSNHRAMALAAALMREEAQRIAPGVETDLFTPAAWVFRLDSDGDYRSLVDPNDAYRRAVQLAGELEADAVVPADGEKPDFIYTLLATRLAHAASGVPGVSYDLASSIGLVYTGPETGPQRYRAVTASGRPVPRTDPSEDRDICSFDVVERSIAFCVKYSTGAVLLAHCEGFALSRTLERYAERKGVRIIRMPLKVLPRHLQTAVHRRIFLTRTLRWSGEYGERIADRMVFWRLADLLAAPRLRPRRRPISAPSLFAIR